MENGGGFITTYDIGKIHSQIKNFSTELKNVDFGIRNLNKESSQI